LWERFRGISKYYDADLDYKQKIEEMRGEWEEEMMNKVNEKDGNREAAFDDDEFPSNVSTYFQKTTKSPMLAGREDEKLTEENGQTAGDVRI